MISLNADSFSFQMREYLKSLWTMTDLYVWGRFIVAECCATGKCLSTLEIWPTMIPVFQQRGRSISLSGHRGRMLRLRGTCRRLNSSMTFLLVCLFGGWVIELGTMLGQIWKRTRSAMAPIGSRASSGLISAGSWSTELPGIPLRRCLGGTRADWGCMAGCGLWLMLWTGTTRSVWILTTIPSSFTGNGLAFEWTGRIVNDAHRVRGRSVDEAF